MKRWLICFSTTLVMIFTVGIVNAIPASAVTVCKIIHVGKPQARGAWTLQAYASGRCPSDGEQYRFTVHSTIQYRFKVLKFRPDIWKNTSIEDMAGPIRSGTLTSMPRGYCLKGKRSYRQRVTITADWSGGKRSSHKSGKSMSKRCGV